MTVVIIAGDTIIGKGRVKIVPNTWQPSPLAQGIIGLGNYLKNPGQILHDVANIPAIQLPTALTGQPPGSGGYQPPAYRGAQWTPSSTDRLNAAWDGKVSDSLNNRGYGWSSEHGARSQIPVYNDAQGNAYDAVTGRLLQPNTPGTSYGDAFTRWHNYASTHGPNPGQPPAPTSRGQDPAPRSQVFTAGAGPNGPNPNAIVQGQDGIGEEYRQRLNAYNNQAVLARQALQGYDPSKGPLPGAAQEASDQGMDIWKDFYAGSKMAQPGGAVGTFNPLMQARGDVPSMEELWQGIGGGAPTAGPSQDAIKAAIARGVNQPGSGGFFVPPGSPSPLEQAQQQQLDTAAQAGSGTEASTAMQRTEDFIKNIKFGALNPNNYSLPSSDYLKNYNWNTDFGSVFK